MDAFEIKKRMNALFDAEKYDEAFATCKKYADEGLDIGYNNLGYCYDLGLGTEQDFEKAFENYSKAADTGSVAAFNNLGVCYLNGKGVEKNEEKALEYFEKAAVLGSKQAQYTLGGFYAAGTGVPKGQEETYLKIANWYRNGVKCFDIFGKYPEFTLKYYNPDPEGGNFSAENGVLCVPYGVKTIAKSCFLASHVQSITLPEGVETIEARAFYGAVLTETVVLPSTVKSIGESAFYGSAVKNINLPKGLTRIEEETFAESNVKYIKIPNTVTFIGKGAFKNCKKLRKIFIPDSVDVIEEDAFKGCCNLGIYLETDVKPTYPQDERLETFTEEFITGGYDYHRAGSASESIEDYVERRTYEKLVPYGWNPELRAVHAYTTEEKFDEMLAKLE